MKISNPAAIILAVSALSATSMAMGQTAAQPVQGMTSPAQSVGLFVFPQNNQTQQQQLQDEGACYGAAKSSSGVDPTHIQVVAAPPPEQSGGGVKGAARGAAGGAAIGAIAGDAGKGAAIGATVGVVRGRRNQNQQNAQAQQQSADQVAAAQQQQISTFKRAMSACMESKHYSVK